MFVPASLCPPIGRKMWIWTMKPEGNNIGKDETPKEFVTSCGGIQPIIISKYDKFSQKALHKLEIQ
jgi:hypothetical protein